MSDTARPAPAVNRWLAALVGAGYVAFGGLGALMSSWSDPLSSSVILMGFSVNMAQAAIHVVVGVGLVVAAARGLQAAKTGNTAAGVLFLALGITGLFVTGTDANVLALNSPDHVLHFASAAVLLGAGLGADREARLR